MVAFLFIFIACVAGDYDMKSIRDENLSNMLIPDCVNTVYFDGHDRINYWLGGVDPEDILEQFVDKNTIEAIHTGDHSLHGFTYGGQSGEGIIIRYHNVPRESISLGNIFGYSGDSDVMISSWTTYYGDYQSLATVYILFPIESGLAYYNRRQILDYDQWFEPGLLSWKADQYFYGLPTDLGEQLRSCLYKYDNYLYGPVGSQIGELP